MRRLFALALVFLAAACSAGRGEMPITSTSSTAPPVTTPTTDPGADCRQVAEDAVSYLEDAVADLDDVSAAQLADRAQWPESLRELEARGEELDRRVSDLGCDLGAVQQEVVLRAAELSAQGPLGRLLLDLLVGRVG